MSSLDEGREFFAGDPLGLDVFDKLAAHVEECGGAELRVSGTQVAWARRRGFAQIWSPARWLGGRGAPWALSVGLPSRDPSPRWKQVVEIRPDLFTHHLEIRSPVDIDVQVLGWLREAYDAAG